MRPVRFLLGDELVSLRRVDPTMTVLDWLRTERRRTGTKEGCNEGDCGACTVVIGRLEDGRLRYRAVNACIQLLAALDGCHLLTVEDLTRDGRLHPVQAAMVACHASQCGFCTPGFVMSIYALWRGAQAPPDDAAIDRALAGNLCRCTGYAPIARAVHEAFGAAPPPDDDWMVAERLRTLQDEQTAELAEGGRWLRAPATVEALSELLRRHPRALIVAGTTDVGLWLTKRLERPRRVIWLGRVQELAGITRVGERLRIGAGVTWSRAEGEILRHYPELAETLERFGSVQVRNVATVGGNIANGSPVGDGTPSLIAAGATVHLFAPDGRRSMPLEAFYLGYGRQDRRPGEIVEAVEIDLPRPGTVYRCWKISKRRDQDISAVLGAFRLDIAQGRVAAARLAYGGMAPVPARAPNAEAALVGRPFDEAAVADAVAALERDFTPIDDLRASARYRMRIAGNLLRRLHLELTHPDVASRLPLRDAGAAA